MTADRSSSMDKGSLSPAVAEEKTDENDSILEIFKQCDTSTLIVILICNFIQGFEKFLDLILLDIYKNVMKLQPADTTALMGMNAIPWSFKIIYGFLSDNFFIFGTRRKGHILMNITIAIVTMLGIIFAGESLGKYFVTACVTLCQMTMAYNDTVTDGLTVQATKVGHDDFSERVNSLAYILGASG